jgi:hypothetical protein
MKVLPESFLKCMRPEDRAELGRAGRLQAEADARGAARSEKALQRQIENYLRLRGIEVIRSRMDRKTSNNVGTPDLLFAVENLSAGHAPRVYALALEVKLPGRKLDPEQEKMREAMTTHPNGWTHRTVNSVEEVKSFLDGLGL